MELNLIEMTDAELRAARSAARRADDDATYDAIEAERERRSLAAVEAKMLGNDGQPVKFGGFAPRA